MGCGSSIQARPIDSEQEPQEPQNIEEEAQQQQNQQNEDSRPPLKAQSTRTSLHSPLSARQPSRPTIAKQATKPVNEDPKSLNFLNAAKENNFHTVKVYASIVDLNIKDVSI